MKALLPLILCFCSFTLLCQPAIEELKRTHSNDPELLKKIETFHKTGVEKDFNYGNSSPTDLINSAMNYLNVRYKFGGTSIMGMDCSGFIMKTMQDLGLTAPHNAQELAKFGKIILDKNQLRPGDLIFFTQTYSSPKLITHAGFMIADHQMIHSSRKGVRITSIDENFYHKRFIFGTRLFPEIITPMFMVPNPISARTFWHAQNFCGENSRNIKISSAKY